MVLSEKNVNTAIGTLLVGAIVGGVTAVILHNQQTESAAINTVDLTAMLTVDPELILYDELEPRIQTGLESVRTIAVDNEDNIYVTGSQSIRSFTSSGQKRSFSINLDQDISSLLVSEDKRFYVGVGNHIQVFDQNGTRINQWKPVSAKSVLTSIGLAGEDVFAADIGMRVIHHYKTDGSHQGHFGDFVIPSFYFDLAISPNQQIIAAHTGNHRLETYNLKGDLLAWWGAYSMQDSEKFCGCCNPVNFALLPNEQGFVTCEKGITRVKWYNHKGEFMGFVAGPQQFSKHDLDCDRPDSCFSPVGLDVAVDSKGRVLILEPREREVRIFVKKPANEIMG